jgi:hypothetical protein
LKKGENPKIMIVNRILTADKNNVLARAPKAIDVEVREIWQPWLKARCNFAVRYIVPSRLDILKIMASRKLFRSEVWYQ